MPTIGAMALATIVSFIVGDLIPDSFGMVTQFVVGTIVWYLAFYKARTWLRELRNG